MTLSTLEALSPLDGRYHTKMTGLNLLCSEYGLQKARLIVEIRWLQALSEQNTIAEVPTFSRDENTFLDDLITNFSIEHAQRIKTLEQTTNHDVKAIEYFIKEQLSQHDTLKHVTEFIHFACTSEDINNLAYGIMLRDVTEQHILTWLEKLITQLTQLSLEFADLPLLSRTHGQSATPTTLGKEFANVVARFKRQQQQLLTQPFLGKCNGAVGNYNAHVIAYPEVDWQIVSEKFITEKLNLSFNPYTTQIEPHDAMSELFAIYQRINTILIDFDRDMWRYISLGFFKQQPVDGEVGSSTMPHKINPIDFENSEGNLGIANSLLQHFCLKLPISRWQRDLSDSTVLRNIGIACGYMCLSFQSTLTGLGKLAVNEALIRDDLSREWAVLAEAIQTVMRRYRIEQPYEKLKALTRGQVIDQAKLAHFIESLKLPDEVKKRLLALTPETYLGYADNLAKDIAN